MALMQRLSRMAMAVAVGVPLYACASGYGGAGSCATATGRAALLAPLLPEPAARLAAQATLVDPGAGSRAAGAAGGCRAPVIAGLGFRALRVEDGTDRPQPPSIAGGEAQIGAAAGDLVAIEFLANLPGLVEAWHEVPQSGSSRPGATDLAVQRLGVWSIDRLQTTRLPRSGAVLLRPQPEGARIRLRFLPCAFGADLQASDAPWPAAVLAALPSCALLARADLPVRPHAAEMTIDSSEYIATVELPSAFPAGEAFAVDTTLRLNRREP